MKRILVIGATGRVGRQVVAQLPTNLHVRALARNPESANLPPHVEVVRGDLTAPESLDAALHGIEAVFLVWTAPPATIAPAIDRTARVGLVGKTDRRIVLLSSPHRTPHPFFQQPNPLARMHAQIENTIASSGLQWTILRPGMFSANAREWWPPQFVRAGLYGGPISLRRPRRLTSATSPPSPSAPCVPLRTTLPTPARTTSSRAPSLSRSANNSKSSAARSVIRYEARRELPFPLPAINMLFNAWAAAIGQPALVTNTFAELTGTAPRTFHQWATDNASHSLSP